MNNTHKDLKEVYFVNLEEAGDIILNMLGSDEYKKILENCSIQSSDFKQGAIFGATMAFNYISAYANKYTITKKEESNEEQ